MRQVFHSVLAQVELLKETLARQRAAARWKAQTSLEEEAESKTTSSCIC
jgi:hypothetical protein